LNHRSFRGKTLRATDIHGRGGYDQRSTSVFETEVVKLFLLSCSLILLLLLSCQKDGLAAEVKDGKTFYVQYCSACHGQEGHGNGPTS
jgi:hypothetical protein